MANNEIAVKKRIIYAEDLFDPVDCKVHIIGGRHTGKTMAMYEQLFRERVAMAPTVDAVEVVHARWEDEYGGKYANPRYRCSACKGKSLYKFKKNDLDQWEEVQALTPYCPHCNATMDGGTDHET